MGPFLSGFVDELVKVAEEKSPIKKITRPLSRQSQLAIERGGPVYRSDSKGGVISIKDPKTGKSRLPTKEENEAAKALQAPYGDLGEYPRPPSDPLLNPINFAKGVKELWSDNPPDRQITPIPVARQRAAKRAKWVAKGPKFLERERSEARRTGRAHDALERRINKMSPDYEIGTPVGSLNDKRRRELSAVRRVSQRAWTRFGDATVALEGGWGAVRGATPRPHKQMHVDTGRRKIRQQALQQPKPKPVAQPTVKPPKPPSPPATSASPNLAK